MVTGKKALSHRERFFILGKCLHRAAESHKAARQIVETIRHFRMVVGKES